MKYNTALKQLDKEMEFLGVPWERLVSLLIHNPLIFRERTMEAWKVVLKHHDNCLENII